tara:strand:+ start:191 stop:394 length:204 start_codon:yes stop_codon:yes gene_type:complete
MEIIYMKKKYSFTLDEELIDWFKKYCKEEYTNMSCTINQYILDLKRNNIIKQNRNPNKLPVKQVIHS